MKKVISLYLSLFLYSQYSFSICLKPVTFLKEGQKVECDGYLFTPEKEYEVRNLVMQNDKLYKLTDAQQQHNNDLAQQLMTKAQLVNNLNQQVQTLEKESDFQKYLYFAVGLVLGGYTVNQIKK